MDQLLVPLLSEDIQGRIVQAVAKANRTRTQSGKMLESAEERLAAALGLGDWSPLEPLSYISASAAVRMAGRFDSQYFMPAKTKVMKLLAALPGTTLGDVFDSVRDMVDPQKDSSLGLVRNFDVTHALEPVLDDEQEPIDFADVGSIKKRMRHDDLAISRLRSYLKEIAIVQCSDSCPTVGSSEFIVLRPKAVDCLVSPSTLMTFLRSGPVQTILKWCQDGSQHPRFSESDLLAIPLPDAVRLASAQIDGLVSKALSAREKARELLDAAKRAVEIAIEQDEAAALHFLESVEA